VRLRNILRFDQINCDVKCVIAKQLRGYVNSYDISNNTFSCSYWYFRTNILECGSYVNIRDIARWLCDILQLNTSK
jgi:hypothetical protein